MRRAGERGRWIAAGVAAVVASGVGVPSGEATATAVAAPEAQVMTTVLPVFDNGDPLASHAAQDINNSGQIVGLSADRPVLWQNGQITDLGPGRPDMFSANWINDRGQIVGQTSVVGGQHAYLLTDGQVVDIDGDATSSQAHDINERGDVYLSKSVDGHDAVGVWSDGTFREIVAPADHDIDLAYTLSENGHVAGTFRRGVCSPPAQTCTVQAFVWQDGTLTVFPGRGWAQSVNASGDVIGFNDAGSVVWRNGVATPLGILPASINDRGQIVGRAATWWGWGPVHAFLWQDGWAYDLGTLGGSTSSASRINERGQVTGISTTASGATHAFLWDAGQMHDLGPAAGAPAALNDRGQAIGYPAGTNTLFRVPVLWELR